MPFLASHHVVQQSKAAWLLGGQNAELVNIFGVVQIMWERKDTDIEEKLSP